VAACIHVVNPARGGALSSSPRANGGTMRAVLIVRAGRLRGLPGHVQTEVAPGVMELSDTDVIRAVAQNYGTIVEDDGPGPKRKRESWLSRRGERRE
jgi:hypothetical protein